MSGECAVENCELAQRYQGRLKARFAAVRVPTADGPPQRIRTGAAASSRGRARLFGEHRASGEKKYYSPLAAGMDLRS